MLDRGWDDSLASMSVDIIQSDAVPPITQAVGPNRGGQRTLCACMRPCAALTSRRGQRGGVHRLHRVQGGPCQACGQPRQGAVRASASKGLCRGLLVAQHERE